MKIPPGVIPERTPKPLEELSAKKRRRALEARAEAVAPALARLEAAFAKPQRQRQAKAPKGRSTNNGWEAT